MGEASKRRDLLLTCMESPVEKQLKLTSSPICRLSPRHGRSTLLDSFELQAVMRQLNRAMQGAAGSPPACMMNSPFYRRRLGQIFKENAKTSKKLICSQVPSTTLDRKVGIRAATVGFVGRLWKKVKQGLQRNKQPS